MTPRACIAGLLAAFSLGTPVFAQDGGTAGVSRTPLGAGLPAAAPGQELSLRRVTFAPGASIPGEVHSGMQVVFVVSGRLGLQVLGREAVVRRARPDGSMGPEERLQAASSSVTLGPGDTALETETLVLHPFNAGSEPLIILAASLLQHGKPQGVPITQAVVIPGVRR